MGYLSIHNLYKDQTILQEREVYALEKIHGTSAHIHYDTIKNPDNPSFFSGGLKHGSFMEIFNHHPIKKLLIDYKRNITIYGEAYGGKMHKMSKVYGDKYRFVVFDIKIDNKWLNVVEAYELCTSFQLEFVYYVRIPALLSAIDMERDAPSIQAIRNGCGHQTREGIVLRPIQEKNDARGNRIIAKHKHPMFSEVKTNRHVDEKKFELVKNARLVAEEWVTEMRLTHVLDKCLTPEQNESLDMSLTPTVLRAMRADIKKESEGEIEWNDDISREISRLTAQLYKTKVTQIA